MPFLSFFNNSKENLAILAKVSAYGVSAITAYYFVDTVVKYSGHSATQENKAPSTAPMSENIICPEGPQESTNTTPSSSKKIAVRTIVGSVAAVITDAALKSTEHTGASRVDHPITKAVILGISTGAAASIAVNYSDFIANCLSFNNEGQNNLTISGPGCPFD